MTRAKNTMRKESLSAKLIHLCQDIWKKWSERWTKRQNRLWFYGIAVKKTKQEITRHLSIQKAQNINAQSVTSEKLVKSNSQEVQKESHAWNNGKLASNRQWTTENWQNDVAAKTDAIRKSLVIELFFHIIQDNIYASTLHGLSLHAAGDR